MYIAFEGGEGAGKSTQARLLAERLDAVLTREPGATPLGAKLRALLLETGQAAVSVRAETLLMAADRAQHLDEVITPALAAGRHVVSDRSVFSSMAYQGGGRQLGVDAVWRVNDWALAGCWPDLVVLLDIEPGVAAGRLSRALDRMEQAGAEFHHRVWATYLELASTDQRWVVVPAAGTVDEVSVAVWAAVEPRLVR
jgi:dTMP kinase